MTTIVGPGFIALAAMIFGKWNPIGAMLLVSSLELHKVWLLSGNQLPLLKGIPSIYLQIAPYVLTMSGSWTTVLSEQGWTVALNFSSRWWLTTLITSAFEITGRRDDEIASFLGLFLCKAPLSRNFFRFRVQ